MSFLDKNGLTYFYSKIKEKFIRSVNSQTPDDNGNVLISNVATADNLTSPDAKPHNSTGFIYRTSGGTEDLASGEAELIYIDGASEHTGYIPESYTPSSTNGIQVDINKNKKPFTVSGEYTFVYYPPTGSQPVPSWTPASVSWEFNGQPVNNISEDYGINVLNLVMPRIVITNDNNNLTITIVPNTWTSKGLESGTYYLSYQEAGWSLNEEQITLNDYGINITGTPVVGNTIVIEYVQGTLYGSLTITYQKEVLGTIEVAKPTQFISTGFNQFDKNSMIIENATIQDNQIVENSGTYVCYCREPGETEKGFTIYSQGGYIKNAGWCESQPEIGVTVITDGVDEIQESISHITFENTGYIVVTVDNTNDLCIHPTHSGINDQVYNEYVSPSIITFPTQDVEGNPLPLADYGMPAVHGTADRLNLDLGTYIQRIGRITNNPESWNFIINNNLRDKEEHDSGYIYYILPTPVVYQVTTNPTYIVNDIGTEEFVGTTVPIPCQLLYGQNLRDKLRNDVITISSQDLTDNQKNQVLTNIGAVDKTGDTMTGDLTIFKPSSNTDTSDIILKSTDLDSTVKSQLERRYIGKLLCHDKNGKATFYQQNFQEPSGNIWTMLRTRKNVNNVDHSFGFSFGVDNNGNGLATFDTPAIWRKALGLNYKSGDTFNGFSSTVLCGFITDGGKSIRFPIILDKSTEDISSISITALTGNIRGIQGYVDDSSSAKNFLSGYTIEIVKTTGNSRMATLYIRKTTAFTNAVNNTPVTGTFAFTLKFT